MASDRPKVVQCADCSVEVPVISSRGRLPSRCPECLVKHRRKQNSSNMRKYHGYEGYHNSKSEGFDLALRTTDMRMAIELSIPLLNMALLRPDLADRYIKQAIDHLENGRGGARVDIRDKTDISVITDEDSTIIL